MLTVSARACCLLADKDNTIYLHTDESMNGLKTASVFRGGFRIIDALLSPPAVKSMFMLHLFICMFAA